MEKVNRYISIGDVYRDNKDKKKALNSYLTAYHKLKLIVNEKSILEEAERHTYFIILLRLGDVLKTEFTVPNLLMYYGTLLKLIENTNLVLDMMICYERIGDLYSLLGESQLKTALEAYQKSNALAIVEENEELKNNYYFIRAKILSFERMGHTFIHLKEDNKAMCCFERAIDCIKENPQFLKKFKTENSVLLKDKWQLRERGEKRLVNE
ncbi:MAG: hypothetical protein ACRCU3_02690 [Eubacteriaceae bacterium]